MVVTSSMICLPTSIGMSSSVGLLLRLVDDHQIEFFLGTPELVLSSL